MTAKQILPRGHICNPPFTNQDDKRWRCGVCRKEYWYNKTKRRWELIVNGS